MEILAVILPIAFLFLLNTVDHHAQLHPFRPQRLAESFGFENLFFPSFLRQRYMSSHCAT